MKKLVNWLRPTRIITRWQAATIHFTFSLFIFIVVTILILSAWYPGSYFWLGGLKAIVLIAGVDLVLGPILTLIIYDINKKSLPIDLAIIALLQIGALTFGISTIQQARPILQIQSYDKVYVLTSEELQLFKITATKLAKYGDQYPTKVYMDLPDDQETIEQIELITSITEDKPLIGRDDLYLNYPYTSAVKKYNSKQQNQCLKIPLVYLEVEHMICLNLVNGNFSLVNESE